MSVDIFMVIIMENRGVNRLLIGVILVLIIILQLFTSINYAQNSLFTLVSYSYKSSSGSEYIYPGSRNIIVTVNVLYNGPSPITISAGCIQLPEGFTITRGYSTCAPPQTPNGTTYETVNQGDIVVFTFHIDVENNVAPGVYLASLAIQYRMEKTSVSEELYGIILIVSQYPELALEVVDWYWSPAGYPGSENVYLYITLKNTGKAGIVEAYGATTLDPNVFTPSTTRFTITNLDKNDFITITLGPFSINPDVDPAKPYTVKLEVNATMRTDDNVSYEAKTQLVFNVSLNTPPPLNIEIVDYGFQTIKTTSNTKLARFYIVLVNKDFKNIRSIHAYFTINSENAYFANNSQTSLYIYSGLIEYSGVVSLYSDPIILVNNSSIELTVKLVLFGDDNGAEFWSTLVYNFTVNPVEPVLNIKVSRTYWSAGEVYPGSRGAVLNIVIENHDVVDIRDAVVSIHLPRGFQPSIQSASNIAIPRGSLTTVSFTGISIDINIAPGEYPATIVIEGFAIDPSTTTYFYFTTKYTTSIVVSKQTYEQGLILVDSGWLNNWPVYPNTENATLQVVLGNKWPYRLHAIEVKLLLPQGFHGENHETTVFTYIPGPINPRQEITIQFTLSIDDIQPGIYNASLRVSYVLEAGIIDTRIQEEFKIPILVNNPHNSIKPLLAQWIGKSPEPPEYGAILMVAFRNELNPVLKGAVLELELPEGFLASDTNTTRITSIALNTNILQQLQLQPPGTTGLVIPPQLIQQLLSQTIQQSATSVFNYGDVLYFYLKLNVLTSRRGVFEFKGYLNYIDQWNNPRRIPVAFNVSLLGSTKIIEVNTPISLRVVNGTSSLEIHFVNKGSAPLYNVYVYLVPYSGVLIPQDSVKYIGELPPGELVRVNYTLIYNPIAIMTSGVQAYLRYMSVPFTLTIVYRDVYGYVNYYNTSLAVLLEPFIELSATTTKVALTGNTLSISGILVNYGIATARSIVARAVYNGVSSEALIGDLDPASQTAFRVELKINEFTSTSVLLSIIYRDEYGRINELNYTLPITRVEVNNTTTQPVASTSQGIEYGIVVVFVAVFLGLVAFLLHRYLRKHSPKTMT